VLCSRQWTVVASAENMAFHFLLAIRQVNLATCLQSRDLHTDCLWQMNAHNSLLVVVVVVVVVAAVLLLVLVVVML